MIGHSLPSRREKQMPPSFPALWQNCHIIDNILSINMFERCAREYRDIARDSTMALLKKTHQEILLQIAERLKKRRLGKNLTQQGLARRSGVSLGTLKRFERTGEIAISKLLALAVVLDGIEECDKLFAEIPLPPAGPSQNYSSAKHQRCRGRIS